MPDGEYREKFPRGKRWAADRDYSPQQLTLFAEYQERRAIHRPKECHSGARCWVFEGPPAFVGHAGVSRCLGCGGHIKMQPVR